MAKAKNYNNEKIAKKLNSVIAAVQKALPELQTALWNKNFTKAEMKKLVALSKKLGDSIAFFDSEIQKQIKD